MSLTLAEHPAVAERSRKLVAASERLSLDPFTYVDWSIPVDDRAFHLPPELLPLYGTHAWEAMDDAGRRAYSRHECASLCGAGIWFENILMQLLLRHTYDMPATDPTFRYLLVEVADECRHSSMFGEYQRRAGTPAYQPQAHHRLGGKGLIATADTASAFIAVLAAEELLDASNKATMNDERVHPIPRQMAKLHVLEEARHVSFARTWLTEMWSSMSRMDRLRAAAGSAGVVRTIADAVVNPAVYDTLGIDGGAAAARRNPRHRERIARDLTRLTSFLDELGAITPVTRPAWRALGLRAG